MSSLYRRAVRASQRSPMVDRVGGRDEKRRGKHAFRSCWDVCWEQNRPSFQPPWLKTQGPFVGGDSGGDGGGGSNGDGGSNPRRGVGPVCRLRRGGGGEGGFDGGSSNGSEREGMCCV
uniref:Uncharacterized protein n=1 Tax=Vespula pensylvanica TaxID=30213 RepID=A0A834PGR6_VESPE|nr:hypothetical protein H0235_001691 [Vespula pensylvanica]